MNSSKNSIHKCKTKLKYIEMIVPSAYIAVPRPVT